MVVGGQPNFVKDKLSRSLKRHGISVHTHLSWTKRRPPAALPKGIDLVYICTDMVGHNLAEPCVKYARENGIPFVNGTRKWAESMERLTAAGFPLLDPMNDLPEIIEEVILTRTPGSPPTKDDLRGIAIAVTGNVEKAEQFLDPTYNAAHGTVDVKMPPSIQPSSAVFSAILPEPEPVKETPMSVKPVPPVAPVDSRTVSLGLHNIKQQAYLKALIDSPRLMNKEMWDLLKSLPLFAGNKLDPQRAAHAREQLGIKVTRADGKRIIDIDLEKFMETAEALKVKYNLPEAHYEEYDGAPVPVAPAPVKATAPVRVETIERLDMKSLLVLLRDRMKEENFVELHITESGITYKRVQVTEGELEL